jgi:hypothetical protein
MSFLKVRRLKQIEDLIFEANLIVRGQESVPSTETGMEETGSMSDALKAFDEYLDKFLDRAIDPEYFKNEEVKKGQQIVIAYLEYCKKRLARITEQLIATIRGGSASATEIKRLNDAKINIIKKISLLDDIYESLKLREEEEIQKLADEVTSKIKEVNQAIFDSYMGMMEEVGKKNREDLQKIQASTDTTEKSEIAKSVVSTWAAVEEISAEMPEPQREAIQSMQTQTYTMVENEIGAERFQDIRQDSSMSREEIVLLERILRLGYTVFTTEEELEREFKAIRAKINALHGSTGKHIESKPETIKYMTELVDEAYAVAKKKLQDKSIDLNQAKGIHFDFNTKLKLHEVVDLPVTGKQIADASKIMKLRKAMDSILDFLFGGHPDLPLTPAGQAWANFGKRVFTAYARTLNTAAKAVGKVLKGREGEMKADALSRMFIISPDTFLKDDNKGSRQATFEEAVAPGVSPQVPGSIGGMGNPVAPTPTSLGSGDNFNPKKRKKSSKKDNRVLEFNEFVNQFLK